MTTDLVPAHLQHCRAAGFAEGTTITKRAQVLARLDAHLAAQGLGLETAWTGDIAGWLATPECHSRRVCERLNGCTCSRSAQTKDTYRKHIVGFYRWAVKAGHLDWNPAEDLVRPSVPDGIPKPIAEAALARVFREAPALWQLPFHLAAEAGFRAMEIAACDREWITEEAITIVGKGGETRLVPTHPSIWALVRALPRGPILPSADGGRRLAHNVTIRASAILHGMGLAETIHCLRHRFATQLLLPRELGGAGADIRTVQLLMGHASLATTQRYLAVTDRQRRLAIASLPVLTTPLQAAA